MKRLFIIPALLLASATLAPPQAHAQDIDAMPGFPEIEALIHMHKTLYSDALKSSEAVTLTIPGNIQKKDLHTRWNEARDVVNRRLDDVSGLVALGASLTTTSLDVYNLAKELADFIKDGEALIRRNPASAFYYYRTLNYVKDEVNRLKLVIMNSAFIQTGVMKATLEQKFAVINSVGASVTSIRGAMRSCLFKCRWMLGDELEFATIREILSSAEMKQLANSVIELWRRNH